MMKLEETLLHKSGKIVASVRGVRWNPAQLSGSPGVSSHIYCRHKTLLRTMRAAFCPIGWVNR